ncbi:protein ENTREP3 isoform X2 [Strix aluco]|uniref:protein ENTREP3 isoform X2 n=1 Tax=Strix aluco TaxID=111821 RepID=UPI003DA34648
MKFHAVPPPSPCADRRDREGSGGAGAAAVSRWGGRDYSSRRAAEGRARPRGGRLRERSRSCASAAPAPPPAAATGLRPPPHRAPGGARIPEAAAAGGDAWTRSAPPPPGRASPPAAPRGAGAAGSGAESPPVAARRYRPVPGALLAAGTPPPQPPRAPRPLRPLPAEDAPGRRPDARPRLPPPGAAPGAGGQARGPAASAGHHDPPAGARRSRDGEGGASPGAALGLRPAALGRLSGRDAQLPLRPVLVPRQPAEASGGRGSRVAVGAAPSTPPGGREEPPSASSRRRKVEPGPFPQSVRSCSPRAGPVLARGYRLPRGSGGDCPRSPPGAAMPSPSDSSRSLTGRTSRSLTHLRGQRTWLQILLVLGFIQVILGVLIVTFSLVAATITPSTKIRHSCPSWAGFSLALSGLIGIISWKRPLTLVITFFTLLSVLGVMLSLAGSILSCQNAQLVKSLEACEREKDSCVCCQARLEPPPASCSRQSEMLTMFPNPDCRSIRMALKDLLFSVCGLTIFSTIVCTLSAVVCCIQIFSLDIVHVLVPQRSSSVTLECTSPPDTFLQSMMDFEEFVPPVPPPPYYPPEYTCSSETDAQSITYNGSMDSPVPLYPTDFPPSYETVMGLRGDSQATLFDSQLTDGSHACTCDRVPSIVLSGEVSMDSGSLIMSEIMDIPGDSSPSEDSCLLELQGSMRSVDYVLFRSIQRSRADYCLSVDCVQCSHHARSPTLGLQGPFEETPQPRVRGERSYSCSTAEPGHDGILVGGAVTHSCNRLEGLARCVGPCFPEVRLKEKSSLQGRGGGRSAGPSAGRLCHPRRNSETSCPSSPAPGLSQRPLVRSHSDPGVLAASRADFREEIYTKALEDTVSNSSADTGLCSEACLLRRSHCDSPPLLRASSVGKNKLLPSKKVTQQLSKTTTRSLGDLKVCRGTRGLVARFLQRPKRSPAAGVEVPGHSSQGHKQVPWSAWPGAERPHEGIHLQSCGDLSSTSSLRRLLSARRLERGRPRSLSGTCKESVL